MCGVGDWRGRELLSRAARSISSRLGCDAVAAADLREFGYPGFAGLGLPAAVSPERNEPYIYHFPDGNASLARLLVRALIPAAAPGSTMDDVVLAPFDYEALDRDGENIRIRLGSTCVNVRDAGDGVLVGYVRDGTAYRIAAKHVVLACFHMMIIPAPHADAAAGCSAQRWRRTSKPRSSTRTCWCATGRPGCGSASPTS